MAPAGDTAKDAGERKTADWLAGPDDKAIVQVPVTRRQVRAAVVAMVVAMVVIGVVATSANSPTVRIARFATWVRPQASRWSTTTSRQLPSAAA